MKWNDLKTNPPTGREYAIILFPCRSDCGILYTTSNPQYAIKNGIEAGYTHWANFELAPTHAYWAEWQGSTTPEQNLEYLSNVSFDSDADKEYLEKIRRKKAAEYTANVYRLNAEQHKQ